MSNHDSWVGSLKKRSFMDLVFKARESNTEFIQQEIQCPKKSIISRTVRKITRPNAKGYKIIKRHNKELEQTTK